jgi:hypothetical protein
MKLGHIEVYGINKVIVGEKAVWKIIRDRWVKFIGDEAKDGKTKLEMHDYLNGMYYAIKSQSPGEKDFKIVHRYEIGINGDAIHIKRVPDDDSTTKKVKKIMEAGKKLAVAESKAKKDSKNLNKGRITGNYKKKKIKPRKK